MLGFNFDKRILYVAIAIFAISAITSFSSAALLDLLLSLPAVIIAISFHEFSHAWMAVKLGDETPRNQGRLTLNPLSHMDPVGIILLIFAGFGWGKPVEINPNNFDRKYSTAKGEILVSLAGPVMNFILAIIFAIIMGLIVVFSPIWLTTKIGMIVFSIIQSLVVVNIGLGVFNLIPLPPLDGSKVLVNSVSYNTKRKIEENEKLFYIAFLLMWITGLAGKIITPIIRLIYTGLMSGVLALIHLFI